MLMPRVTISWRKLVTTFRRGVNWYDRTCFQREHWYYRIAPRAIRSLSRFTSLARYFSLPGEMKVRRSISFSLTVVARHSRRKCSIKPVNSIARIYFRPRLAQRYAWALTLLIIRALSRARAYMLDTRRYRTRQSRAAKSWIYWPRHRGNFNFNSGYKATLISVMHYIMPAAGQNDIKQRCLMTHRPSASIRR